MKSEDNKFGSFNQLKEKAAETYEKKQRTNKITKKKQVNWQKKLKMENQV